METDALRRWGVMKACSTAMRAVRAPAAARHGYTLVELLVAATLGSVVLASLGGALLVSEMKVSGNIQRNLYAKDAANRAIDLMRREASYSRYIAWQTAPSATGGVLDNCIYSTSFALIQPSNAIICYKTVALTDLPAAYGSAFQGPCVLVRLGPPYKPNGSLDLSTTPTAQVLLDGLARTPTARTLCTSTTAFDLKYGSLTAVVPSVTRDASVVLTLASGPRYSFSVRVPSNPAYDGNDLYDKCTVNSASGCGSVNENSYHFRPLMNSTSELVPGDPSRENIFYFQYPYSDYTLRENSSSGSCTYASCYVERSGVAVRITNVDILIFSDRAIRPNT